MIINIMKTMLIIMTIFVILIIVVDFTYSLTYTKEDIQRIETKIKNGEKPNETELIQYIMYLQDEIVKLNEEKKKLVDDVIKEKNEKIAILEEKIKILSEQKKYVDELIKEKESIITDKENKIKQLEDDKKQLEKQNKLIYPKIRQFELSFCLGGGYRFGESNFYLNFIANPKFNINDNIFFCIQAGFETNFKQYGFLLGCQIGFKLF